jgi:hypothetical protein
MGQRFGMWLAVFCRSILESRNVVNLSFVSVFELYGCVVSMCVFHFIVFWTDVCVCACGGGRRGVGPWLSTETPCVLSYSFSRDWRNTGPVQNRCFCLSLLFSEIQNLTHFVDRGSVRDTTFLESQMDFRLTPLWTLCSRRAVLLAKIHLGPNLCFCTNVVENDLFLESPNL